MRRTSWKKLLGVLALASLTACATPSSKNSTASAIQRELDAAAQASPQSNKPDTVSNALLPPLAVNIAGVDSKQLEARFDIAVNNTPANQVFTAIVSGTRYSMLVHQDVSGSITINLKDVTIFEALETIRELYGYDYKIDGTRIYIQPISLQTRLFQVNYLTGLRTGSSSLRVSSGSISDTIGGSSAGTGTSSATTRAADSSKVSMSSNADFWGELSKSLTAIVGNELGRSVVISPMTGIIVIRAMPPELKNVAAYLKASQISVERQVILEAKIVEVQLNDSFQSGVNWGAFKNNPNSRTSVGQLSPGAGLSMSGSITNGAITSTPGTNLSLAALPGQATGALFGLAFQTSNFAALLSFLESQGNVHVLSSPRIATLNDQKAVLKVGTDEFFVTEVSGGTQGTTSTSGTSPTIKVQPFFSGIMLDVTPRIDENNEIILHVHPSVSVVTTVNKTVELGGVLGGTYNLPLASSSISETDSIVRARDGQIVAIGGLMRQATYDDESGLPGLPKRIFGQANKRTEKRELVILIKPTVVDSNQDWSDDITRSRDRVNSMSNSSITKP